MKLKIPNSFKLFATTINVVVDEKRMEDIKAYGYCEYSYSRITLSKKDGLEDLSDGRMMDCFYHEKVHMILSSMKRDELNKDEEFVDIFAKLLRQSDETAKF